MTAPEITVVQPSNGERSVAHDPYDAVVDATNLTKDQLLVWAGQQVHHDHRRYSELALFHIAGPVDVERFRAAFDAVVEAHDALRLVINAAAEWPQQIVGRHGVRLQMMDVAGESDPEGAFRRWLATWTADPFAPGRPPWRSVLVRCAADRFVWVLFQHQLVSDAWSFGLIFRRLRELYATGGAAERATPAPQFLDYVAWERHYRRSQGYQRSAAYWADKLAPGSDPPSFYEGRNGSGCGRLQRVATGLGSLTAAIERVAAGLPGGVVDLNLFAVFCAACLAYVTRLSGSRPLVVGVPYANRGSQRFKETVGSFMHICPLRIEVDPGEPAADLLERVRAEAVVTSRHQQYAVRNPVRARLYDVVVNYQRHVPVARDLGGWPVRIEWPTLGFGNHSLAVQVSRFDAAGGFEVGLDLNAQAFGEPYRQSALAHYLTLLTSFVTSPLTPVGRLRMMPANEERRMRAAAGAGGTAPPARDMLLERVARRAELHPGRIAVVASDEVRTYEQLWAAVSRVADHLRARGIDRGAIVGAAVTRDVEGWTILLGILACGAAYVPLDRDHPAARLRQIITRARCGTVVVSPDVAPHIAAAVAAIETTARPSLIAVPDLLDLPAPSPDGAVGPAPSDLFYVIFTSGSTGVPKGIMVEHRGMANHAFAKIEALAIGETDRVAQMAPMTFDVSVWQWFTPLCMGGEAHLLDDEVVRDPRRLLGELARRRITIAATVPSMLRAIVEELEGVHGRLYDLRDLRWLVVTGEVLSPDLCRRWLAIYPDIPLVNAYGPSECSDDVTHHVVAVPPDPATTRIPIGTPIADAQVWILDDERAPVPAGVMGELWIGGTGVARGYLDDPERTAAAFIADPFAMHEGARLYRTGDLGWYRPDGVIEFAGRRDRMTKIRGQRVEPGELEAVLRQHPAVADAVVTSPEDPAGGRRLAAYVVGVRADTPASAALLDARDLRRFVAERLPECMVPATFIGLERLPLTANGKVDHAALPAPVGRRQDRGGAYVAPRTPVEEALAGLFGDVLHVRPIGIDDDFFELGGDSLRAAHLAHRVRERWLIELPVHQVLDHSTVATLAVLLASILDQAGATLDGVLAEAERLSEAEAAADLEADQ